MTNQIKKQSVAYDRMWLEDPTGALIALRRAAIVARCIALETEGKVMIYRDGETVWETDPQRIFPDGVEVKLCQCGRVLEVKDDLDPATEEAVRNRYKNRW